MKRKWNENHICESSPATKKSKNSKTGAEGASCGLPASPEVRRARGEKSKLPRYGILYEEVFIKRKVYFLFVLWYHLH